MTVTFPRASPSAGTRAHTGQSIDAATLQAWLRDGDEIALLDVREHGQYGEGHPFLAVSLPYSRLELDVQRLVPRRDTRLVLFDEVRSGVAERAAARLLALGYTCVCTLAGGAQAWAAAGRTLFQGQNLPSKTFGERVEQSFDVPHISPMRLQAWLAAGKPVVLLDGRTPQEHRKMTIPGAIPLPNGELALRWPSVVPDPDIPVVVHCAGRTRSIVGAQILRDIGLPNPVYALENGTQGWALEGLELERGSARELPPAAGSAAREGARRAAQALADRTGVAVLSAQQAQAWLDDVQRTTFVFDVRTAAEFEAGSQPGVQHVPGGQLLQTTDQHVGVRNARVLLLDEDGIRAPVVAAWLRRLGVEAATVSAADPLRLPIATAAALPPAPEVATAQALLSLRGAGQRLPVLIDLRPSASYRQGHAQGAHWSIRPRLTADARRLTEGELERPLWLLAEDEAIVRLAAQELREAGQARVSWLPASALTAAGWPQEATPRLPSDAEAIDYLFFVHDRHEGNLDAARRYLQWETGLLAQCAPDELAVFRLPQEQPPVTAFDS
jgi:rhodanese-related sulfurtransferase